MYSSSTVMVIDVSLLKNLKIDIWYKTLLPIGITGFFLGLFFPVHAFNNVFVSLVSLGLFFIGIGEWVNHSIRTQFLHETFYYGAHYIHTTIRKDKPLGWTFDVIGSLLIVFALLQYFEILNLP